MPAKRVPKWRQSYQDDIRKLVIQRNLKANRLGKMGQDYNAVAIPKLDWKDVVAGISNKGEYDAQRRMLLTFINSDNNFSNFNAVTMADAYAKELKERVRVTNLNIDKEAAKARKLGKNAKISGGESNYDMGDARISTRKLSERDFGDYGSETEFSRFAEQVFKRSTRSNSAAEWQRYKENYVNRVEDMVDNTNDPFIREVGYKIVDKLKAMGTTRFKNIYYSDLNGEISYLYPGKSDEAIYSRINDIAQMFGFLQDYE